MRHSKEARRGKMWRRSVAIGLVLVIVCAVVTRSEPKKENAGITGVILVSPIRPGPVRKGSESPAAAPLPNATFTITSDDGAVTKFTTDTIGRFKILLKPAHYVVQLAENRYPKPCGPFDVTVEAAKMTNVQWRCDSGMR